MGMSREDYLKQLKNRFFIRHLCDSPEEIKAIYGDEQSALFERMDDGSERFVGCDGGEPEDQVLLRDWQWVAEELNAKQAEVDALRAKLAGVTPEHSWGGEPIRTSASGTAQAMGCTNVQKPRADPAGEGGGDGA